MHGQRLPINVFLIFQGTAFEKVHARLPIERLFCHIGGRLKNVRIGRLSAFQDPGVTYTTTGKFEELDTGRTYGVRPFQRVFGVDDAT